MASFKEDQKKVAQARKNLEKAEASFYRAKIKVLNEKDPDTLAEVRPLLSSSNQGYLNAKKALDASIAAFYRNHQFKQAAAAMNANIPVLFLPLRLETRFVSAGNTKELWVRIYPDDIHVHTHEPLLTEKELEHGKHYWKSLLKANREGGDAEDKDVKKEKAWEIISEMSGVQRGLWIVKQTMPKNWKIDLNVADNQLQFPVQETKKVDWTRAPRTQVLPDKFAVSIIRNKKVVKMELGRQVPDTVFLGPDPFQAEEAYKKEGDKITFDDSFAWITDFDKAIEHGLGVKIKLKPSFFNHAQIDRVVVMGLMSSASAGEGRELLEQLIENHHYSRKGFSFMPQMSATNNTEEKESAYAKNEDYLPKKYYDGSGIVDLENAPNAEGNNFAEYLGVNTGVLSEVNHADMVESFEASAMNKALYTSTIGNFVEVLADPVVSKSAHPRLRQFFNNHVTAAGPIPCIRIGDQPYGTLITSDLRRWKDSDNFHNGLTNSLRVLQGRWDKITANQVVHVGKSGDPGELMLNILGLNAGSVSFRQRLGHLPDFWITLEVFDNVLNSFVFKQGQITKFLESMGFKRGNRGLPYISNLTFYDFSNHIPFNHLIDRKKPSDTRFLAKDKTSKKNYIEWLASVTKVQELERRSASHTPTRSILYLLLRHALLQELKQVAESIYGKAKVPYKRVSFEKSLYNFNTKTRDITEWEVLSGIPSKVDSAKLKILEPIGDHILKMRGNARAARNLKEMRDAMKVLAKLPTSKLHKYLSDHIDLCTYRLDAWQGGLFYKKLLSMRKQHPAGIYLGAYGWVENLRPGAKKSVTVPEALKPENNQVVHKPHGNAGFIHTPSLNHATAAGVLLSGYQNHATKTDPGPFAVNLSSERVRRALYVLEGIQNGQSLEALLGYQFERALHDITTNNPANNLNKYILTIREKFPIAASSIPQQGNVAQEVVSPFSVVNGLKIIKAKAAQLEVLVPNANHAELILNEKDRLEDTLDALSDLMVSEAAFQATQGKTDRTAAILNSLKNAEVPPELEVNKTPRSTHLSITNRVSMHFDTNPANSRVSSWSANASPRSDAEPGLNLWLSQTFGDPKKILCVASHSATDDMELQKKVIKLADLGLQPIDLVFSAGEDIQSGAKELEYRITKLYRKMINIPKENTIHITFKPDNIPAGSRSLASVLPLIRSARLLLTTSRPAHGKDFRPQSKDTEESPQLLFGYDDTEIRTRVVHALNTLNGDIEKIHSKAPNGAQPKTRENPATFKQLFTFHKEDGSSRNYIENISFTDSSIDQLLVFLEEAGKYGIKVSYPDSFDRSIKKEVFELVETVAGAVQQIQKKIKIAEQKLAAAHGEPVDIKIKRYIECGKAVLGEDFVIIPRFKYTNPNDIVQNLKPGTTKQLLKFITEKEESSPELALESWMESVSRVRPNMRQLELTRMISETQGGIEMTFIPAQMPFKEKDSWLAVEFPESDELTGDPFNLKDDTVCLAVYGAAASRTTELQSALLVDEWTEFIPNENEVTGIAFNYDQPNATSPNTLLLAVEPTGSANWNWDVLMGVLEDTLTRAKSRAVEPAQLLEDSVLDTLSPMTVANFDLNKSNVSLDYLVTRDDFLQKMKNKNFELYKDFSI